MDPDINRKMAEARQGIRRLQKIDIMLDDLQKQKQYLQNRVTELREILNREDADVMRLEKMSLTRLVNTVLGRLDAQLAQEKKEALAAKLKYDQAVREQADIHEQVTRLTIERNQYLDCEQTYNELYTQKRLGLLTSGAPEAQKVLVQTEQLNAANGRLKEVREAIQAGQRVLTSLDNASSSLGHAEGWGVYDLFGGGLIADVAKHSHIDDAQDSAEQAQSDLQRFKTELMDVQINTPIQMETGGFAKFADFFFDGLIADWFMQSRISDSQDSVTEVRSQVRTILDKLSQLEADEIQQIAQLQKSLEALVTQN